MQGKDFNLLNDMTNLAISREGVDWEIIPNKSKYEKKDGRALNRTVIKRNFTSKDDEEYDLKLGQELVVFPFFFAGKLQNGLEDSLIYNGDILVWNVGESASFASGL